MHATSPLPLAVSFVLAFGATARAAPVAHTPLDGVIADYDPYTDARDPISAGQRGDKAAATRWPDDSPAAVARNTATLRAMQARLKAIPATG